uniref:cyclin-J-like protein isoform 2 n=1 Tax=Mus musculus TaxID=10090 RepID=UPI003D0A422D
MDEPWWEGRVASDVHCTLREKELKLPTFRAHSPLLKSRRFFVDILTLLSRHCHLCPSARHLAIYLLDHFMDQYNITTSKQLYTVAVSCLLLANHIFYKFQPSVVAAACVGASRICLQLSPYWTRDLQRVSSYSLEHLSTCIEILLVAYDNVLKDAVAVKSQTLAMVPGSSSAPAQVLFQPPTYPTLSQPPPTTLAQFQSPAQDLCLAYRDSLQAHRSGGLLSGDTGPSLHTPYPTLQPLDMCPVPVPASLSMQMAIAAEPRHCLTASYGSSYFSGSHMFPAGCFDS